MFSSVPEEDPGLFITELIRFSNQAALLKTERCQASEQNRPFHTLVDIDSIAPSSYVVEALVAAPLMPLNDRDLKVLQTFFQQDSIHEIELDIVQNLRRLQPEPCWDDDPMTMEFLKDYL